MADSSEHPETKPIEGVEADRAEPVCVGDDEAGLRLDRWFKRHFPAIAHGQLEKMLRTGQIRIDGRRAKASDRLIEGQMVRVPPLVQASGAGRREVSAPRVSVQQAEELRERVLYRDAHVIVIDKPAGLAVQGGSKTVQHLDGMLDALADGGERPRLVHRLDKDTSGVLLLARSAKAAAAMSAAFRTGSVRKLYWAAVVGVPEAFEGRIEQPLAKRFGVSGERVGADDDGQPAVTEFHVVESAGRRAAWLALEPYTGRTHQLRAHCALIGTPILGDGKYGGNAAFLAQEELGGQLHLHARTIQFPNPGGGRTTVTAPLPPHMRATWRFFGFSGNPTADVLADRVEPKRQNRATKRQGARSRRASATAGRRMPR